MTRSIVPFVCALLGASPGVAQDLVLDENVPAAGGDFFEVAFTVPANTAELEVVRIYDEQDAVLDFGLYDPDGFRGWGGGNKEPLVVGTQAASRSYLPGPMPAGEWTLLVGKARTGGQDVPLRVEVTFRSAATLAVDDRRGPYEAAVLDQSPRWYLGDFHVHSRESGDAVASLDDIGDFAASRGLDFVVITDHNTDSHLALLTATQAGHPNLLFIPGMELTTYQGHLGVYGVRDYVDHRLPLADQVTAYRDQGALVFINHPVLDLGDACIGCAFEHESFGEVSGVEVQTGAATLFTESALAFWDTIRPLDDPGAGVLGAVGGSDDHRAGQDLGLAQSPIGSPTTRVFASSLSEAAILEGVAAGLTVVQIEGPEGPTLDHTSYVEDFEYSSHTIYTTGAAGTTLLAVVGGAYESVADLTEDDQVVEVDFAYADHDVDEDGVMFVRFELWRGNTPAAVSGHLRIHPCVDSTCRPSDNGNLLACSCDQSKAPVPAVALAALAGAAVALRRRRCRLG